MGKSEACLVLATIKTITTTLTNHLTMRWLSATPRHFADNVDQDQTAQNQNMQPELGYTL